MSGRLAILPLAALLAAAPAAAATVVIVSTDNTGSAADQRQPDAASLQLQASVGGSYPEFDTTLGTLTDVQLTIADKSSLAIDVTRFADDPATDAIALPYTFARGVAPLGSSSSQGGLFTLAAGQTTDNFMAYTDGTFYFSFTPDDYAALPAQGLLFLTTDLTLSNRDSAMLGLAASAYVSSRTVSTYTFTYTPFVPEPTSWAMFIGGFGLVGSAMRRRRPTAISFA